MLTKLLPTLAALLLMLTPAVQADHHNGSDGKHAAEVSSLMSRVESNALDLREQAARIRSYNRTPTMYDWRLHADELSRFKASIDNISDLLGDLKDHKPHMTMRQATAYNHIVTLTADAANVAENAIKFVNTERAKLNVAHPEYEKMVDALYNHADSIAAHADSVESWADLMAEIKKAM